MTIYTLKETLHDRITILEAGLDQTRRQPASHESLEQEIALEARLEETRVFFKLVDQVAQDQVTYAQERREYPLYDGEKFIWGEQSRGNWPDSTFGAEEAEPGIERHDPKRC
jgi:hypothetical protein